MEQEFVTLDYLGTLAGCIAIVTALTQILKLYVPSVGPKWWALIGSIIVIVIRQLFVMQDLSASGWAEAFINLLICIGAASGLYSYLVKPVADKIAANKIAE